jgi:hypothetical protein
VPHLLASGVDYPIVAVRAPRKGDATPTKWQQVKRPIAGEAGSDLVILWPDGREEVLVDAGGKGMVLDPAPSLDGQWVYYAFVPDQTNVHPSFYGAARLGADIYKIHVATRQVVRLTHQEWTPALGVAAWAGEAAGYPEPLGTRARPGESTLGYGIYNTGPCEVPGGRVIFTSSRNGYLSPKVDGSFPNFQLYAMDTDGQNVEQVGYLNIGSALHPTLLTSGHIMWSSWESQGLRDSRLWGLWYSLPDGRHWGPLWSAFTGEYAAHFATQQPDGKIVCALYYVSSTNNGFGTLFRWPHFSAVPADLHTFHSQWVRDNPKVKRAYGNRFGDAAIGAFTPWGFEIVTAFANQFDRPAPPATAEGDGRYGRVTHPAAGPDGLVLVFTPGPGHASLAPQHWGQIAWLPYDTTAVEDPKQLKILKADPKYNYQQPRPLVSWERIYGSPPAEHPWCPNDGSMHEELPAGTPFGLVGSSSVYNRASARGNTGFYKTIASQGGDVGTFSDSDIHAIRLVQTIPQSHYGRTNKPGSPHRVMRGWQQAVTRGNKSANERMRIMGEIPLRKTDAAGDVLLDSRGDPDTSFLAKIPADVPFTFQLLDKKGKVLVQSQTWHQLRPGEVRNNCGGCHAHDRAPVDFASTAAAKPDYQIVDLTAPPRDVEWHRDVKAIIESECQSCHTANSVAKAKMDLTDMLEGLTAQTKALQARISPAVLAAEGAPPHAPIAAEKVRTLAEWIDLGRGVDEGKYFYDNINPTLTVAAPSRDEAANTIVFGAFDNESGLDMNSLFVTLNKYEITDWFSQRDHIWTTTLGKPIERGILHIEVKDKQCNIQVVDRWFSSRSEAESSVAKAPAIVE